MCFSVAYWANISKIVYGCNKTEEMIKKGYYEGHNNIDEINAKNNYKIDLIFKNDYEKESLSLISKWEKNNSPTP
jgi:tRNA(Arg) A34 adenosine deaminase TadA